MIIIKHLFLDSKEHLVALATMGKLFPWNHFCIFSPVTESEGVAPVSGVLHSIPGRRQLFLIYYNTLLKVQYNQQTNDYSWKCKVVFLPNVADPGTKQKPLPNIPQYHVTNKHQDVLVWDIEDNFEFQVKGIRNVEITSDQVRDNIDKVKK